MARSRRPTWTILAVALAVAAAAHVGAWAWLQNVSVTADRARPRSFTRIHLLPRGEAPRADISPALSKVTADWSSLRGGQPLYSLRLPVPALRIGARPPDLDDALAPRAPTSLLAALDKPLGAGSPFVRTLLAARSVGLDVVFVIERARRDGAFAKGLLRSIAAVRRLFPRTRLGAVTYSPTGTNPLDLGATPDQIRGALTALRPAAASPGKETGLGKALVAAAALSWSPRRRGLIVALPSRPPQISDIPNAVAAALRFRRNARRSVLLVVPAKRKSPQWESVDRLIARGAIKRIELAPDSDVAVETLTFALGKPWRRRIVKTLSSLMD